MTAENGTAAAEQRIAEIVRELKLEKHPEAAGLRRCIRHRYPLPKAAGSGPWRGVSTTCLAGRISLPSMRSIVMSFGIIMKARGCGCMF